jgi:hypothetical protein
MGSPNQPFRKRCPIGKTKLSVPEAPEGTGKKEKAGRKAQA